MRSVCARIRHLLFATAIAISPAGCIQTSYPDAGPGDAATIDAEAQIEAGTIVDARPADGMAGDRSMDMEDAAIAPDAELDASLDAEPDGGGNVDRDADAPIDAEVSVCAEPHDAGVGDAGCDWIGREACLYGDRDGLCRDGICEPCVDVVDDSACGPDRMCLDGECVPGNCRSDVDCDVPVVFRAGTICGLQQPRFCYRCGSDSQCQQNAYYGPSTYCNTSNGHSCEPNTCPRVRDFCIFNQRDICCSTPAGNQCVMGACCTNLDCQVGRTCVQGSCLASTCPPPGNVYFVDPSFSNRSADNFGNGSAACPVHTVTRALSLIGHPVTSPVTIEVLGELSDIFPIVVPENVYIVGNPAIGASINGGGTAFILANPSSGISRFVIDGLNQSGSGVQVVHGSTLTTTIDHVQIVNMREDGIVVRDDGAVTIGPGVVSSGHGLSFDGLRRSGLLVDDDGWAVIEGAASSDPSERISFNDNSGHGIHIRRRGRVTIAGTPGILRVGTVQANDNELSGLRIEQTPVPAPPRSAVDGLVARNNGTAGLAWSGIDIRAGSNIRLRNSVILGGRGSGIRISTFRTTPVTRIDDVSLIDLGTHPIVDPGANVVQSLAAGEQNEGAGICMLLTPCAGSVLSAAGQIFSGPNDCQGASTGSVSRSDQCAGGVDVAVSVGSSITIDNCH